MAVSGFSSSTGARTGSDAVQARRWHRGRRRCGCRRRGCRGCRDPAWSRVRPACTRAPPVLHRAVATAATATATSTATATATTTTIAVDATPANVHAAGAAEPVRAAAPVLLAPARPSGAPRRRWPAVVRPPSCGLRAARGHARVPLAGPQDRRIPAPDAARLRAAAGCDVRGPHARPRPRVGGAHERQQGHGTQRSRQASPLPCARLFCQVRQRRVVSSFLCGCGCVGAGVVTFCATSFPPPQLQAQLRLGHSHAQPHGTFVAARVGCVGVWVMDARVCGCGCGRVSTVFFFLILTSAPSIVC